MTTAVPFEADQVVEYQNGEISPMTSAFAVYEASDSDVVQYGIQPATMRRGADSSAPAGAAGTTVATRLSAATATTPRTAARARRDVRATGCS